MAEAPRWLTLLVDAVGNCMEAHGALGPLAFRWREEDDFWDVAVYSTPGEVFGGANDGTVVVPGFSLDLQELISSFEELMDVHWRSQPLGPQDDQGQHISIEGVYQGRHVYLQVLAEAPGDEKPGFKVDLSGPRRNA